MTKRVRLELLAALWVGLMPVLLLAASLTSSPVAPSMTAAVQTASSATSTPPSDLTPTAPLPEARLVGADGRVVVRPAFDGATSLSSGLPGAPWTLTPATLTVSSSGRAARGRPAVRAGLERWRARGLPARAGPALA